MQTNIERRLDKTLFAGLYADVSSIWQSCICIVELSVTALPGTEDTNQGIMSQMWPSASTKAAEARGNSHAHRG